MWIEDCKVGTKVIAQGHEGILLSWKEDTDGHPIAYVEIKHSEKHTSRLWYDVGHLTPIDQPAEDWSLEALRKVRTQGEAEKWVGAMVRRGKTGVGTLSSPINWNSYNHMSGWAVEGDTKGAYPQTDQDINMIVEIISPPPIKRLEKVGYKGDEKIHGFGIGERVFAAISGWGRVITWADFGAPAEPNMVPVRYDNGEVGDRHYAVLVREAEMKRDAAPVETFPGGFKVGDRVRLINHEVTSEFQHRTGTVTTSEEEKKERPGASPPGIPVRLDERVRHFFHWILRDGELEHIKESEPIKKEEAMKNGEILECNFGRNDWFRGVIIREERNIANALFYSSAAADCGVGHGGGCYYIDRVLPKSSEHGHWYLHSQMEGIEWRKFGKGSEPPSEHIPDQACGDDGRECKDRDKMTIEAGGAVNRLEVTCRFCGSSYFAAAPEKHYHDPRYFDTRLGEPLPEPDLWNCTNPQCGASGRYIDYPPPMGDCPKCGSEIQDRPKR